MNGPDELGLAALKKWFRERHGRLLAEYREAAGLSQERLAMKTGVPRQLITDIESGRRDVKFPRDEEYYELMAHAMKCEVKDLIPDLRKHMPLVLRLDELTPEKYETVVSLINLLLEEKKED